LPGGDLNARPEHDERAHSYERADRHGRADSNTNAYTDGCANASTDRDRRANADAVADAAIADAGTYGEVNRRRRGL
jgi:hypothetical protein